MQPAAPSEVNEAGRCGIAWRRGNVVACPPGGCALLVALGFPPRPSAHDATPAGLLDEMLAVLGYLPDVDGETCPVEALAGRSGFDPTVLATLDELRRELDRVGLPLATARATRTRERRHEAAMARWGGPR